MVKVQPAAQLDSGVSRDDVLRQRGRGFVEVEPAAAVRRAAGEGEAGESCRIGHVGHCQASAQLLGVDGRGLRACADEKDVFLVPGQPFPVRSRPDEDDAAVRGGVEGFLNFIVWMGRTTVLGGVTHTRVVRSGIVGRIVVHIPRSAIRFVRAHVDVRAVNPRMAVLVGSRQTGRGVVAGVDAARAFQQVVIVNSRVREQRVGRDVAGAGRVAGTDVGVGGRRPREVVAAGVPPQDAVGDHRLPPAAVVYSTAGVAGDGVVGERWAGVVEAHGAAAGGGVGGDHVVGKYAVGVPQVDGAAGYCSIVADEGVGVELRVGDVKAGEAPAVFAMVAADLVAGVGAGGGIEEDGAAAEGGEVVGQLVVGKRRVRVVRGADAPAVAIGRVIVEDVGHQDGSTAVHEHAAAVPGGGVLGDRVALQQRAAGVDHRDSSPRVGRVVGDLVVRQARRRLVEKHAPAAPLGDVACDRVADERGGAVGGEHPAPVPVRTAAVERDRVGNQGGRRFVEVNAATAARRCVLRDRAVLDRQGRMLEIHSAARAVRQREAFQTCRVGHVEDCQTSTAGAACVDDRDRRAGADQADVLGVPRQRFVVRAGGDFDRVAVRSRVDAFLDGVEGGGSRSAVAAS